MHGSDCTAPPPTEGRNDSFVEVDEDGPVIENEGVSEEAKAAVVEERKEKDREQEAHLRREKV